MQNYKVIVQVPEPLIISPSYVTGNGEIIEINHPELIDGGYFLVGLYRTPNADGTPLQLHEFEVDKLLYNGYKYHFVAENAYDVELLFDDRGSGYSTFNSWTIRSSDGSKVTILKYVDKNGNEYSFNDYTIIRD